MNHEPDLIATALKMFYSLAIILGVLLVAFYFIRRVLKRETGGAKNRLIRVLANTCIGVKKSVSLVEVPGALLVLGITNDRISLLAKIEGHKIPDEPMPFDEGRIQESFLEGFRRLTQRVGQSKSGR